MQAAPPDDGGGGITINFPTVDWDTLIPQLVDNFFNSVGKSFDTMLHSAFDGLWNSGVNVVGHTDLAMTWNFGPVHDQVLSVQAATRAVLVFALVVLGLRGMLSGIVARQPDVLSDFINGVLTAVILLAAFPLLIPEVIRLTNEAASAVGRVDLSAYVSTGGISSSLVQVVLFAILLFFVIRLLVKCVWRIGFLAVLLPVGVLACALYAVSSMRWMLGWWARVWGGMLLAQIPSVMALTIGAQMFAHGSGLAGFVYSIAFLQLATDLYSLVPFGRSDPASSPFGGMSWPVPAVMGALSAPASAGVAATSAVAGAASGTRGGSGPQMYGYQ
jgi:hypothetical protein